MKRFMRRWQGAIIVLMIYAVAMHPLHVMAQDSAQTPPQATASPTPTATGSATGQPVSSASVTVQTTSAQPTATGQPVQPTAAQATVTVTQQPQATVQPVQPQAQAPVFVQQQAPRAQAVLVPGNEGQYLDYKALFYQEAATLQTEMASTSAAVKRIGDNNFTTAQYYQDIVITDDQIQVEIAKWAGINKQVYDDLVWLDARTKELKSLGCTAATLDQFKTEIAEITKVACRCQTNCNNCCGGGGRGGGGGGGRILLALLGIGLRIGLSFIGGGGIGGFIGGGSARP